MHTSHSELFHHDQFICSVQLLDLVAPIASPLAAYCVHYYTTLLIGKGQMFPLFILPDLPVIFFGLLSYNNHSNKLVKY